MSPAQEYDLTSRIIGLAMRVHSRLGPGLLESAYERCLCFEFERNQIPFARQVDLPLNYDGFLLECGYRADIIIQNELLPELKAVDRILPVHEAQLLTYLRHSGCKVGLLLNFNAVSLKDGIRRASCDSGPANRQLEIRRRRQTNKKAYEMQSPLPIQYETVGPRCESNHPRTRPPHLNPCPTPHSHSFVQR